MSERNRLGKKQYSGSANPLQIHVNANYEYPEATLKEDESSPSHRIPTCKICLNSLFHALFSYKLTAMWGKCLLDLTIFSKVIKIPGFALYPDVHQKLLGSHLIRSPSSCQVLLKSIQRFSRNPAQKQTNPTNQPTDGWNHSLLGRDLMYWDISKTSFLHLTWVHCVLLMMLTPGLSL